MIYENANRSLVCPLERVYICEGDGMFERIILAVASLPRVVKAQDNVVSLVVRIVLAHRRHNVLSRTCG